MCSVFEINPTRPRSLEGSGEILGREPRRGLSYLNGLNVTRHLLTIILPSVQPLIIFQNARALTSSLTSRPASSRDHTFFAVLSHRRSPSRLFETEGGLLHLHGRNAYKVQFSKSHLPRVREMLFRGFSFPSSGRARRRRLRGPFKSLPVRVKQRVTSLSSNVWFPVEGVRGAPRCSLLAPSPRTCGRSAALPRALLHFSSQEPR